MERTKIEKKRESTMLPVIGTPKILAMKRVEIISVTQDPSMLIVAPSGREKE